METYKVTDITSASAAKRGKRFYAVKLPHRVTTNGIGAHAEDAPPVVLVQFGTTYHKKGETKECEYPSLGQALRALVDPAGTFLLKMVLWVKL